MRSGSKLTSPHCSGTQVTSSGTALPTPTQRNGAGSLNRKQSCMDPHTQLCMPRKRSKPDTEGYLIFFSFSAVKIFKCPRHWRNPALCFRSSPLTCRPAVPLASTPVGGRLEMLGERLLVEITGSPPQLRVPLAPRG